MGDIDVVQIFESLFGFAKREPKVDMHRQAQRHDVSIVFTELQGGSILRQGIEIHAEKIDRELTIDVVKFIFVFPIILFEVCLVHVLQVMEIVRTVWIYTFVENEVFALFLRYESVPAVRAQHTNRSGNEITSGKRLAADLALILPIAAVVIVDEVGGAPHRGQTMFSGIELPLRL